MAWTPCKGISVGLAAWLLMAGPLLAGCGSREEPGEAKAALYAREVQGNLFDTTPVRGDMKPLRYARGSFTYRCSECHTDFEPAPVQEALQGEHAGIQATLDHGRNTRCLNCHHPENRNAYVAHDGSEIPADQPAQLCGKCHGTILADWEAGVHGRQNGYWDRSIGPRTKLMCVQCHDPHAPAFRPMTPDAPPVYSRFAAKPPAAH